MALRQKVKIIRASDTAWYKDLVGQYLWVNRKTAHLSPEDEKAINLHFAHTDRELLRKDILTIPWPFRKMFHAINLELSLPPVDHNIEDEEESYEDMDSYEEEEEEEAEEE